MKSLARFTMIGHALRGDGPFRPVVSYDSYNKPFSVGESYLIKYPRETSDKYAARNELAYYASPLSRVSSTFVAHIAAKPVLRDIRQDLLLAIYKNADGKGNNADIFWSAFMYEFKARGTMLLLVDMPQALPDNMQTQLAERVAPYWTALAPELVTDYVVGDDGKFDFCEFSGTFVDDKGEEQTCTWYFDRAMWQCKDDEDKIVSEGEHPLGECPVLIVTEAGDFPHYGPFAPIADLSKRLFNLDSELDEILRAQTFSLLTYNVPEESADEERMEAARQAGETIGTNNLLVHTGSTPAFIAPDSGPASTYMERINDISAQINEIGLMVATPNQRESGIAMQMRFQQINAELGKFAARMEAVERRAWELSIKWLGGMDGVPEISWPRDFNIADPEQELAILSDMQATAMPPEVLIEQQKRVVVTQFSAADMERQEQLLTSLENGLSET